MSEVRPLRIAYVIDALFAPAGGTEGQLLHLLERIDRRRFEPTVFCLRASRPEVSVAATEVLDLHLAARPGTLWKIHRFAQRLSRGRFDIVQTHFRDSNIVGTLAARRAGTPILISTRRGVPYWSSASGLRLTRWLDRAATWFIANSEATRDRFAREEGIDPARFTVIYNGLDAARFRGLDDGARSRLRADLGVPLPAPLVGIVANLRPVKGLDDFIGAAALVAEEFPAAHFVIVGQGEEEPGLRELAARNGLGARLHFAGPRSDVPELLQCLDVGVLASHSESFSNSVLEYLAARLPVVVTDVGGVREAVEDGRQGFIVPPRAPARMAEALRQLLSHPGGPRAWRPDEADDPRFRLETMVAGHEQLYLGLAERAGLSAPA